MAFYVITAEVPKKGSCNSLMCVSPAEAPDGFSSQRCSLVFVPLAVTGGLRMTTKTRHFFRNILLTPSTLLYPCHPPKAQDVFLSSYPRIATLMVTRVQNHCNSRVQNLYKQQLKFQAPLAVHSLLCCRGRTSRPQPGTLLDGQNNWKKTQFHWNCI